MELCIATSWLRFFYSLSLSVVAISFVLDIRLECERRLNVSRTSIATLSTPSNTHILICSNNEQIKTNDVLPARYFGPVSCLSHSLFLFFSFIAFAFPCCCDHLLSCELFFFFVGFSNHRFVVVAIAASSVFGALDILTSL